MWLEKFKNKNKETKYRYYEKYKDPLTAKWRRVSVVLNKNGKQSQKEAQRLLNERIEAKLNDKTPTTLKSLTFHVACDEWFQSYIKTSGSKRTTIKTKLSKLNTLKKFVDEDILINKITLSYAQQVFDEMDNKGYVYQVNKDALSIFKNVFEYTRRIYKLQDLEFLKDITLNKRIKSYDEVKAKRNKYLELNEIQSIIKDINTKAQKMHSGIHKRFYLFVALMTEFQALNGMRIGEMLAIQNEDIDFDNKSLNINGTIHWFHDESGGFGVKDTTKTESSYRTIGLSSRSCEILKKAILENKKDSKWNDGYLNRNFVFTNHKGNPMQTERFNKILREATKDVGIDKEVSSHILRHSHISLLSQQGVSLKAIMDRVGHSDHRTTLSIYSHVTEQMDKDMMNKLEQVKLG
ncbi:site-specific integrase [Staphylococcus aureus]|uniref:site-specific integrase n=1 Tax=Staphylococcus aureus TaxID=1280 RepID=UPI0021159B3E|nr:site-specific integrase [Staphylococcus aureus]MCQ6731962.1 site-specific integrase [Staphylococcus aureus]HCV8094154.1 site-specific integrase [Staphylococcus aureus]